MRSCFSGLNLALLLVAGVLGALLFMQLGMEADAGAAGPTAPVPPAPALTASEQAPFVAPSLQSVAAILERPLFSEGRTPAAGPEVAVGGQEQGPPPTLKLEGVAISPDNKVALLRDLRTNEIIRLSSGMSRDGWKVLEVDEGAVRIEHRGNEIELRLEIKEGGGSAASTPPPIRPPLIRPPARR